MRKAPLRRFEPLDPGVPPARWRPQVPEAGAIDGQTLILDGGGIQT